ncbi:MAG TPA: response regulator transcription factor [Smithellaceae bacterium]|nr:response regulator transcription factor [Smithellaceae bacterium]
MKLVIVEDNPLFIENLLAIFQNEPEIRIIATYQSAEEALEVLPECSADILLADLGLPGMSGIELIGRVREILPQAEIMALTVFEDRDIILAAIRAGASSYMLKSSTPQELIKAVFDLSRGEAPMSPRIARKIIREFRQESIPEQYLLSSREKEILREIQAGLAYKEIARKFSISTHTVHAHIRNIYKKLQADNRASALVQARKKGIL